MAITFKPGSVFLNQPLLLDIRQRRFLVGIRFAVEILQIAQLRLLANLERWHTDEYISGNAPNISEFFADVWSIVDNARRLQRLLWKMPGIEKSVSAQGFVSKWPALRVLRDSIQHVDKDFVKSESKNNYVFGQLCWVDSRFRASEGKVYAYTVPAGPQANSRRADEAFPAEIPIDSGDGIDPVIFEAAGTTINISELLSAIATTIAELDAELCEHVQAAILAQKAAYPTKAAKLDLLAKVNSGFRLELSVTAPAQEVNRVD